MNDNHLRNAVLTHHRLHVWHRARELVRLVAGSPVRDSELRSQASRAAKSVALNIAEGAALRGPAKERHYRIAFGSALEVAAAYELAEDLGESVPVALVQGKVAEISRMLNGLLRPRGRGRGGGR